MPEVRLLFAAPEFYSANQKRLKTESDPVVNRTYFILDGRIVAVATLEAES
jgi:hypothetical protein